MRGRFGLILLAGLAAIMLHGCTFSGKLKKRIKTYPHPDREFVPEMFEKPAKERWSTDFRPETVLFPGEYIGMKSTSSATWARFQFPGILKEDPRRVVEVLIPDPEDEIVQRRSVGRLDLVFGWPDNARRNEVLPALFGEVDGQEQGVEMAAIGHWKDFPMDPTLSGSRDVHVILLTTTNGPVAYRPPGGRWYYLAAHTDVRWVFRTQKGLKKLKRKYWYTVPLDMISIPFQLAAVFPFLILSLI